MAEETKESSNAPDASAWHRELAVAEKELEKFWTRGKRVIRRFLDDEEAAGTAGTYSYDRYNVFWANVGVLKAALYANPPRPFVKREFDDYQDDVARVAGQIMERLLQQGVEKPEMDMATAFTNAVENRLIPGLGQLWLRYDVKTEVVTLEADVQVERIISEVCATDFVYWEDFWWSPARTWEEVRWVARRVFMTKKEFRKRFGKKLMQQVSWSRKTPTKYGERVEPEDYGITKTEVFEIWNKPTRTVCWVSRHCDQYLDHQADPLELDDFFPCPKPLMANVTTSRFIPKADYLMVQTQYRRLDNLSLRIGLLEDAIQVSGVYDKANKELGQILGNNANKMIPVDNWAMFAEKGGIKGVIDWFPLDMVVSALEKLHQEFNVAKAELYELTGISDIMRGQTAPRETAYAQGLKAQYSSVRLQYLQGEVANFVQNGLRIKAEIIAKHFQPETILKNSLILLGPDADIAPAAVQLLKDEWSRCYRISIYSDTLAIPDYNAERDARVEYITAVGQFISQAMPMVDAVPESGLFLVQMLQWAAAGFRAGDQIEGVLDKAAKALEKSIRAKQAAPPTPPPPDPAMIKAKAQAEATTAKAQADVQATAMKTAAEIEADRAKTAAEVQLAQIETASNVQQDASRIQAHILGAAIKAKADVAAKRAKGNGRGKA